MNYLSTYKRNTSKIYSGFGKVFSGSGIWPKYGPGFGKTGKILTGFGISLLSRVRDSSKFEHAAWLRGKEQGKEQEKNSASAILRVHRRLKQ